jgi:hypothetical protein
MWNIFKSVYIFDFVHLMSYVYIHERFKEAICQIYHHHNGKNTTKPIKGLKNPEIVWLTHTYWYQLGIVAEKAVPNPP